MPNSLVANLKGSIRGNIRQYTMVFALLFIWVIFQILTGGTFISPRNLSNLMLQSTAVGIAACGIVLVMVAGHIDLSIGSLVGLTGAIVAALLVRLNMDTWLAVSITLVIGTALGAWQGFWVAYRQVPAFIVTLAGMLMFRGGVIGVTKSLSLSPNVDSFKVIGQGYIPNIVPGAAINYTALLIGICCVIIYIAFQLRGRSTRRRYGFLISGGKIFALKLAAMSAVIMATAFVMALFRGIPVAVVILAMTVLMYSVIANKTAFGRHVYAIGGNKEAARLSGINIKRTNMMIFILMGFIVTVAGIVYTSRLNAAAIGGGQNMEMDVIASAIIGGTSTMGGEGAIIGAIIGALVMASLDNGMSLLNLGSFEQYLVKGLILLLAVWVDIATRKKS